MQSYYDFNLATQVVEHLDTCCNSVSILQAGMCWGVVHLYRLLSLNTLKHKEIYS